MGQAAFVYHGSPVLVPVLEPRNGPLHAAQDRQIAIPFALAFHPDDRGRCKWSLHMHETDPRIVIEQGSLDTNAVGYLYRLAADQFEQVSQWRWVSRVPVTPLDHEVIRGADYIGWIGERLGAGASLQR